MNKTLADKRKAIGVIIVKYSKAIKDFDSKEMIMKSVLCVYLIG